MADDPPLRPTCPVAVAVRLDYANPPPCLPDGVIVVPTDEPTPPDFFPDVCCSCRATTRSRWVDEHGVGLPVCDSCRIGWVVIRGSVVTLLTLAFTGILSCVGLSAARMVLSEGMVTQLFYPLLGVLAGGVGWLTFHLTRAMTMVPATVSQRGLPSVTYVVFRDPEFQRAVLAWRGRAAARKPIASRGDGGLQCDS